MENFPDASIKDCDLGPDHVQLTLLNWRPKVNWKNFSTKFRKYFPIHFAYTESCALSKVNWKSYKSIGTPIHQLELTKDVVYFLLLIFCQSVSTRLGKENKESINPYHHHLKDIKRLALSRHDSQLESPPLFLPK